LIGADSAVIEALAPGKVVLWGEYAVLAGAPALVMAVDRYARCTIDLQPQSQNPESQGPAAPAEWRFSSTGFVAAPVGLSKAALRGAVPPPAGAPTGTAWQVLQWLNTANLPAAAAVNIDTSGFFQQGTKLGIGSSAAVCVAVYGAFCELLDATPRFAEVAAIHHRLQGNRGSGIDIAAAWFGGLLRFRKDQNPGSGDTPQISTAALPAGLQTRFLWAGHPALTTEHLQRFAEWRNRGRTAALDDLVAASAALFEPGDCMQRLQHYVRCLRELDQVAELGIYDAAHLDIHRLAADSGVVYKPCGAGVGDIGAAFSHDARALDGFMTSAHARGYTPITLETAAHGIQVRR